MTHGFNDAVDASVCDEQLCFVVGEKGLLGNPVVGADVTAVGAVA